jgi:hypothetical protein
VKEERYNEKGLAAAERNQSVGGKRTNLSVLEVQLDGREVADRHAQLLVLGAEGLAARGELVRKAGHITTEPNELVISAAA